MRSRTLVPAIALLLPAVASAAPLFHAVGWDGSFVHLDGDSGQVGPTRDDMPEHLQALARAPDGEHYAVCSYVIGGDAEIYRIDPQAGDLVFEVSVAADVRGMAFSPSGELYVSHFVSIGHDLSVVDLDDGSLTTIGSFNGATVVVQGLAFSPEGILYGVSPTGSAATRLITIDLDDAETHLIATIDVGVHQSLAFTPGGDLYAVGGTSNGVFARLDPLTGEILGPVFDVLDVDLRGLEYISQGPSGSVPALSSWGALSMGGVLLAAGVILLRRRPTARPTP